MGIAASACCSDEDDGDSVFLYYDKSTWYRKAKPVPENVTRVKVSDTVTVLPDNAFQ